MRRLEPPIPLVASSMKSLLHSRWKPLLIAVSLCFAGGANAFLFKSPNEEAEERERDRERQLSRDSYVEEQRNRVRDRTRALERRQQELKERFFATRCVNCPEDRALITQIEAIESELVDLHNEKCVDVKASAMLGGLVGLREVGEAALRMGHCRATLTFVAPSFSPSALSVWWKTQAPTVGASGTGRTAEAAQRDAVYQCSQRTGQRDCLAFPQFTADGCIAMVGGPGNGIGFGRSWFPSRDKEARTEAIRIANRDCSRFSRGQQCTPLIVACTNYDNP